MKTVKIRIWVLLILSVVISLILGGVNYYSYRFHSNLMKHMEKYSGINADINRINSEKNLFLIKSDAETSTLVLEVLNNLIDAVDGEVKNDLIRYRSGFNDLSETVLLLREKMLTQNDKISEIANISIKITDYINEKEMQASFSGDFLDPSELNLRSFINEFIAVLSRWQVMIEETLLFSKIEKYESQLSGILDKYNVILENLENTLFIVSDPALIGWGDPVLNLSKEQKKYAAEVIDVWKRNMASSARLESLTTTLKQTVVSYQSKLINRDQKLRRQTFTYSLALVGVMVIILMVFGFLSIRSIIGVLTRVTLRLRKSAETIAQASNTVASISHSLTGGSSSQAAAIEQTSASMEEITSMNQQVAGRSREANKLRLEAYKIMGKAKNSMVSLIESMDAITEAGENIRQITKTVNEIAFQTNLLSLNAAVEAARAGEVGAGFAVVAGEVRKLAGKVGKSAEDTTLLIEETIRQISEGSKLTRHTQEAFNQVADISEKVGAIINEISQSTEEQSRGAAQISEAMSDIDKITQNNVDNAEEVHRTSDEMIGYSDTMRDCVNDLAMLIGDTQRTKKRLRISFGNVSMKSGKAGNKKIPAIPSPNHHRQYPSVADRYTRKSLTGR